MTEPELRAVVHSGRSALAARMHAANVQRIPLIHEVKRRMSAACAAENAVRRDVAARVRSREITREQGALEIVAAEAATRAELAVVRADPELVDRIAEGDALKAAARLDPTGADADAVACVAELKRRGLHSGTLGVRRTRA